MAMGKSIVTAVPLKNASIYYQAPGFIADQVLPVYNSEDPTAKITKYLASDFFRNDVRVRAEGAEAIRGGYKTTEVTFSCTEYAFAKAVTDEERRNSNKMSGQLLLPDQDAIELCKRKLLMGRESRTVAAIIAGTWADGSAGGEDVEGKWNSAESSNTFITDIDKAIAALANKGVVSGPEIELRLVNVGDKCI